MTRKIGSESGKQQKPELLMKYQLQYEYKVTGLSEQSWQTLRNQLEWSELVTCSGAKLALASRGELGKRLAWTLTLKIPAPSSGVDIVIKKMLLSMNLEEGLISRTCSGGLIVTRSSWKSKADQ